MKLWINHTTTVGLQSQEPERGKLDTTVPVRKRIESTRLIYQASVDSLFLQLKIVRNTIESLNLRLNRPNLGGLSAQQPYYLTDLSLHRPIA